MAGDPRLSSHTRRKLRQHLGAAWAAADRPCAKCGKPINYQQQWDLDEIIPRMLGGDPLDPTNTQPTHPRCNRSAGATMGNKTRKQPKTYRPTPTRRLDQSRNW